MATNDIVNLAMRGRLGGIVTVNNFAFKDLVTGTDDRRAALAADWNLNVMPTWVSGISNQWSVYDYAVSKVVPAGSAEVVVGPATARVGNDATDPLPPQSAQVLTLRTGLAGRAYRGRVFTSGLAESSQTLGTYTSAWMTNRQALRDVIFGRYITNAVTNGWQIGVISRQLNGVQRVTPVFTPCTDLQFQNLVKRMSSRMVGHGV